MADIKTGKNMVYDSNYQTIRGNMGINIKDISIRWKILFSVAVGPIIIAVLLAWLRVNDIRDGAEAAIVEKSQAVVLTAEAVREEMSHKLSSGLIPPLDSLPKDKVMQAVPVITAINAAAINAHESGYQFRVPKIQPRNPENEPDAVERTVLQEMESKGLTEKIIFEENQLRYFRAVRLSADCLYCHGDPRGTKDPTGGTREGWREGEVHGAFEIISSLEGVHAHVAAAKTNVALLVLACLAVILTGVWLLVQRNLLRPMAKANELIGHIAEGDLTHDYTVANQDEFGHMIRQIDRMRANLSDLAHQLVDASSRVSTSSEELQTISEDLFQGAEGTSERSHSVAAAAEEMSTNMSSVAAAMEETTTNMDIMTGSVDDMKHTIDDISNETEGARSVTGKAVDQATSASKRINQLGQAAREIEKITETITDISEQTNLLALNATIEAARAGEAGKGFAVVANEIKELAKQTAAATSEINQMVSTIQGSTIETVSEIEQVTKIIGDVNETVSGIAQSMSDQMLSTNEIVSNITQASMGAKEVNLNVSQSSSVSSEIARDIAEVNEATTQISKHSKQVANSAGGLNDVAQRLKETVARFRV